MSDTNLLAAAVDASPVSRSELARRLGVSRANVTQMLNDPERNYTVRTLAAVTEAIGGGLVIRIVPPLTPEADTFVTRQGEGAAW